jgi:hypothetical protein
MKVIKCWDIQVWDGGGMHYHKYYVATKKAADEWKAENPHDIIDEREIVILDDMADLEEYKNGELRKHALLKLTEQERKALGL